jgi:hypothetical protein
MKRNSHKSLRETKVAVPASQVVTSPTQGRPDGQVKTSTGTFEFRIAPLQVYYYKPF